MTLFVEPNQVGELVKREKMYDPAIEFNFYSLSKDAIPGKGIREKIPSELVEEYTAFLSEFPDFRIMLSNFAESPFVLDGLNWHSVEHYYQASKFKRNNYEFYKCFSLDSGTELSKNPIMAKAYGGKTGKYRGKQGRNKSVVIDHDFFSVGGRGNREMFEAQLSKFTQNENMRKMLLATKNANLLHSISRSPKSVQFGNLIYFRKLMNDNLI